MLWLAIRFVRLPLEVLTPHPEQPPSVVRERHRVLLASDSAASAGILCGHKIASAHALCDSLQVHERCPAKEQQRLQALAEQLLFLTPHTSLQPPDTLLLEIASCLTLFQGLGPLLETLQASLGTLGHRYQVGLGSTPLAAQLLATHYHDLRTLAREYSADRALQLLAQHPLASLPLADNLREALQAPGFRRLGELRQLPAGALGKRHGKQLLDWLGKLWGEIPDPRPAVAAPLRFRAEAEFNDPVEHAQGLLFPAQRLLTQLDYFLRQRQLTTRALRWQLIGQRHRQAVLIRRISTHSDPALWLDLTRRRFEQTHLHDGVLKLVLECARPAALQTRTSTLFDDPDARPDRAVLLEKLQALPQLQLSLIQEQDDFLPENRQQQQDPLQKSVATSKTRRPADADHDNDLPPLWLLDTPRRLQQRKKKLLWRGAALELLPGEQRLSLNWWQQLTRRRYFIARHPHGICCWVFLDERDQHWYLHGFF